jgi:outer membrane protein
MLGLKHLMAGAALAASTVAVHAADMPLAQAAPPPLEYNWFIKFGPGYLINDESARMRAGGVPQVGATIKIKPQISALVEFGYFFTPNFAVSFTGGIPPRVDIRAAGTIAPLGRLGQAVYGPSTLTAHYHFTGWGAFRPYIGAGVAYTRIFDTKDDVLTNIKINDTIGPALQIGANYMINERWGVFVDVKKAYLRTVTTGNLGPAPVRARVVIDTLAVHTGVMFKF